MPSAQVLSVIARNPEVKERISILLVKVALNVVGEDPVNRKASYIEKRHNLGVGILNNVGSYIDRFAYAILAPNTLTAQSTDSDIEFMITSVFSDIAGVTYEDAQPPT